MANLSLLVSYYSGYVYEAKQLQEPDEPEEIIEVEEVVEDEPAPEPEREPEPQQESRGLFSMFAAAITADEPEEVDEPELDEPEFIVENDPLPIIELSDEVVEASDSITDEQLEDAGISRDDFEIGLQDMVDNPDDYMMDIEEVAFVNAQDMGDWNWKEDDKGYIRYDRRFKKRRLT